MCSEAIPYFVCLAERTEHRYQIAKSVLLLSLCVLLSMSIRKRYSRLSACKPADQWERMIVPYRCKLLYIRNTYIYIYYCDMTFVGLRAVSIDTNDDVKKKTE